MAVVSKSWLYDTLKEPRMGEAFIELLDEKNLRQTLSWSGSFSFTTKTEYENLNFYDLTAEDTSVDPQTGNPRNMRTYNDYKDVLPTWSELSERHAQLLADYEAHAPKRARVYPRVEDQLDMLYKDINAGLLGEDAKNSAFYQTILEIKTNNS